LRFVSQKTDQQARQPGPKVEPIRRGPKQRRGQESILAMSDIDEDGREGGCGQQRFPMRQDGTNRRRPCQK
jgi:hypothetical protein